MLTFLFLFLALPLSGQNPQEDIVRQYYESAKNKNFIIAKKILEACHDNKSCNRVLVMEQALAKAKADKDVSSVSWISSELTREQQSFVQRRPLLCLTLVLMAGIVIGRNVKFPWDLPEDGTFD